MVCYKDRIFASTLSLKKPEDIGRLIDTGMGIEVFAEELPWDTLTKAPGAIAEFTCGYSGPRGLHAPFTDLNLVAERFPEIREITLTTYQRFIDVASELGYEYLVIHPHGTNHFYRPEDARNLVRSTLVPLARRTENAGVKLAIENIGWGGTLLFDELEFIDLVCETRKISAVLDVGHAHLNGWNIPNTIRQLGSRLEAIHLHNNWGKTDEHLPLTIGSIDWSPIWAELARLPGKPALVLEYSQASFQRVLADAEYIREELSNQAGIGDLTPGPKGKECQPSKRRWIS